MSLGPCRLTVGAWAGYTRPKEVPFSLTFLIRSSRGVGGVTIGFFSSVF